MKYAILSVDNSRDATANAIWSTLTGAGDQHVNSQSVDGRNQYALETARRKHPYPITADPGSAWPLVGQLGVWYSVLNAIEHAPLLVIEDDALLTKQFNNTLASSLKELPPDFHFLCLYVPDARYHLYNEDMHEINRNHVVRVWQPNGGVAIYWSERGAEQFKRLVKRDGMRSQWDNQLMQYAWVGSMRGYSLRPHAGVVAHAHGKSIVQNTEPA